MATTHTHNGRRVNDSLSPRYDLTSSPSPSLLARVKSEVHASTADSEVRSVNGWCERRVIAVSIPISQTHSRRAVVTCNYKHTDIAQCC
ncbi:hypothetical protein AB1N83_009770 [Pleurotus pulmonarius]